MCIRTCIQVRLDYAMHEVLELLSLGRSRTNINPEVRTYVHSLSNNLLLRQPNNCTEQINVCCANNIGTVPFKGSIAPFFSFLLKYIYLTNICMYKILMMKVP